MRKTVGLVCLAAGGLAWPCGYVMEYEVTQILPVHLVLIFSGLALRGSHLLSIIKQKRNSK
ncbi:MAG: hypothetical protein ACYC56_14655 [Candidatus Aquicultor sp.]